MALPSVLTPVLPATVAAAESPSGPASGHAWTRSHVVFQVAAGLVGLHVVDDNFLQPPAGTSAADHLVSGLGTLVPVLVVAGAYPRVRAGTSAAIAISLGMFGVIFGAGEAGYYSLTVGPSGDDFTGLLSIPAGATLLGLGGFRLWRSRRNTPNHAWRYLRRLLIGVISIVVVYQTVLPIGWAYVSTHAARAEVPSADLGAAHEDVTLSTSDGLELEGWYVPSTNGAAVIVFPGRKRSQEHARMLVGHGYGVLLLDRRGEGASEGEGNMSGWGGERDIFAAIDFLRAQPDVDPDRIGGLGLSVGGELMLQAAAQDDRLAAVVSEGAGTRSVEEQVQDFPMSKTWPLLPGMAFKTGALALFSNTMPPPRLTELVPEIAPRPTMFIWAPNGGNVETMSPRYHRLAGPGSEIWEIEDAPHIEGIATHPEEYERRVVAFLDDALLGEE
jgi:hypothetical protein